LLGGDEIVRGKRCQALKIEITSLIQKSRPDTISVTISRNEAYITGDNWRQRSDGIKEVVEGIRLNRKWGIKTGRKKREFLT